MDEGERSQTYSHKMEKQVSLFIILNFDIFA